MDLELEGCAAIVGGASSGMGRACAMALAAEGCNVALFARREELLDEAVAEIDAMGTGASGLALPGDSTDADAIREAVERTEQRFGRLDIVVNNTGGPPAGGFEDFDDDAWRAAWELTLMSALRLTRHALPALRRSGRGRVVNITSSAVKEPNDGLLLSNVYRPGVTGWAKSLSQDEGPNGITVNSVAPGYIDTDRMKKIYASGADPEGDRRTDEEAIPARRFGQPEEIADAVVFLCSARAAYVNGITLLIDGGLAKGLLSRAGAWTDARSSSPADRPAWAVPCPSPSRPRARTWSSATFARSRARGAPRPWS
jgi:3-oxoacyl-[acyl-carrier protein] reductase